MGAHLSKNTDVTLLVGRTLGELSKKMAQINAALMFGYKFLQHSAAESETFITMRGLVYFSVCRLLTASSGTENWSICFHQ